MTKLYEMTTAQRLKQLQMEGYLTQSDMELLQTNSALPATIGSHLVENYLGNFALPFGVANHFLINQQDYLIPMATEEPSVIAAASNAAQRVARSGGFQTQVFRNGLQGQIVFQGHLKDKTSFLQQHHNQIMTIADQAHPTLQQHGGGLKDININNYKDFVEFNLLINPAEAMGANVVNTILEAVAHYLQQQLPQLDLLMAILSNQAPQQIASASAQIDFEQLATSQYSGYQVAQRIVAASEFAQISAARAATHNKGIMNGVIATVLATGNDTRNINAAVYAGLNQSQKTLSEWQIHDQKLVGNIRLSLPLGSVGGAISTLPMARLAMRILQQPSATQLMGIVATVGLASNLAALRALVTQGIQAGHMNLQWQSLAIMAGAKADEIAPIVAYLKAHPQVANLANAHKQLEQLRKDK
ncbi:hydroxymethylglutaryl-CoA reductase, degradative [Bombilactobacillus bombi]|uniref:hydroxymethylglutaryl-CoA reductase, degradative n=1 Tax=Bombilactobacillus bombi TaxID=1303590 RepID=UPI000E56A879|nr:hydroxymethylglutaryl-CoA reductase, degradative [Bombilactobacillus bombi]AXX64885.1 hydroxymethylglutaryl-CoA reductase, degradative [Bombilactobacillus bombi]